MRPLCIVVLSPALDDELGFSDRVEDLPVQQFVPEPGVEALAMAILPSIARQDIAWRCPGWAARLDEGGPGAYRIALRGRSSFDMLCGFSEGANT